MKHETESEWKLHGRIKLLFYNKVFEYMQIHDPNNTANYFSVLACFGKNIIKLNWHSRVRRKNLNGFRHDCANFFVHLIPFKFIQSTWVLTVYSCIRINVHSELVAANRGEWDNSTIKNDNNIDFFSLFSKFFIFHFDVKLAHAVVANWQYKCVEKNKKVIIIKLFPNLIVELSCVKLSVYRKWGIEGIIRNSWKEIKKLFFTKNGTQVVMCVRHDT